MFDKIKAPFTKLFIKKVTEKSVSQDEYGHEKYGKYLNPLDSFDWMNMAEEEFVDLGKYMYAEKEKRDVVLKNVKLNTETAMRELEKVKLAIPKHYYETQRRYYDSILKDIKLISKNLDGEERGKASR